MGGVGGEGGAGGGKGGTGGDGGSLQCTLRYASIPPQQLFDSASVPHAPTNWLPPLPPPDSQNSPTATASVQSPIVYISVVPGQSAEGTLLKQMPHAPPLSQLVGSSPGHSV